MNDEMNFGSLKPVPLPLRNLSDAGFLDGVGFFFETGHGDAPHCIVVERHSAFE